MERYLPLQVLYTAVNNTLIHTHAFTVGSNTLIDSHVATMCGNTLIDSHNSALRMVTTIVYILPVLGESWPSAGPGECSDIGFESMEVG
jgi:hypothetical protein